jgi:hypothetical protein
MAGLGMFHVLLALLLVQQPEHGGPHVSSVEQAPDLGHPLSGSDYLLIAEAARHPAMRGADLSCYRIHVYAEGGERQVTFLEERNRVLERVTGEGTKITYLPPDPECRSISFVMRSDGRVRRAILTRH